ncbi:PilZ domain-containing protein [uncultured Oxalicibacterium sp.]|uniref:PilZ domain-containing protein n=1 Tax=uncultured Oxalicibacterium sp. TaxID=1168540 RepID=UPI0025E447BD|nr:PilZ domain-containing protein [uncultured Oxalicibacterium sp.]
METSAVVSQSTIENRRDERYVFCQRAQLEVDGVIYPIRTLDVSRSGFGIISQAPVSNGGQCTIGFTALIGNQITRLKFSCVTSYCILQGLTGYRIGLSITHADPAMRASLRVLIEQCAALIKTG